MNTIPTKIQSLIGDAVPILDDIGYSQAKILLFPDKVLKISPRNDESIHEIKMLNYLQGKIPLPMVLATETANNHDYVLMSRLSGQMASSDEYLANPATLLSLLVAGLQMLWQVDVSDFPDTIQKMGLTQQLQMAEERVLQGLCDVDDAEEGTYGENGFANPAVLLQWLKDNQPEEIPVLVHGDFCLPNIFLNNDQVSGLIDWGRACIGDAYQDIALCYRSLIHNFDGRHGNSFIDYDAKLLFAELGIVPDWDKIRYYILLDELF